MFFYDLTIFQKFLVPRACFWNILRLYKLACGLDLQTTLLGEEWARALINEPILLTRMLFVLVTVVIT